MAQVAATYVSEWDGGYQITSNCLVDMDSGIVTPQVTDDPDAESVEMLDREFVQTMAGDFEVEELDGHYRIIELNTIRASVA
jgi:hypothetical protein